MPLTPISVAYMYILYIGKFLRQNNFTVYLQPRNFQYTKMLCFIFKTTSKIYLRKESVLENFQYAVKLDA